ncbi:iron chelate uptake ABC transporter family permease subunit, partial [Roseomonas sp. GC11]|uniref:iron chelate uptake ABC transporter family permease subunit n=1 Tax=Roseomonas sp. GC11 TaxID=2950546 RepID=UPI002109B410
APAEARAARPWARLMLLAALLGVATALALMLGPAPDGAWRLSLGEALAPLLPWRLPRVLAALAAGGMLGLAGLLAQRLTRNPMASPELLGLPAGAGLAMLLGLGLGLQERAALLALALPGVALVLGLVLLLGRRSGFAPAQILLGGLALTLFMGGLVSVLLAVGDPRALPLAAWMAGSTYAVSLGEAGLALALGAVLLGLTLLCARWLALLPLGAEVARALGVPPARARLVLVLLIAGLTAPATLLVGPLSFAGLLAPHLARLMGLARTVPLLLGTVLAGALLMVLADWLGRGLAYPWQVPAGLVASLLGGPVVLWLMRRAG